MNIFSLYRPSTISNVISSALSAVLQLQTCLIADCFFLLSYRNVLRHLGRIFIWNTSDVLHAMHRLEIIVIMRRMEKHIAGM